MFSLKRCTYANSIDLINRITTRKEQKLFFIISEKSRHFLQRKRKILYKDFAFIKGLFKYDVICFSTQLFLLALTRTGA